VAGAMEGLVARSDEENGLILLHWTRGEGPRQLAPPPGLRGNVFAVRLPLPKIPRAFYEKGVPVITHPDARWHGADLKSTNLLASVLARQEAVRRGAYEAILHRGRGGKARLTEGTSSSFFLVRGGVVVTPAVHGLLPGITRNAVIRVARDEEIPLEERRVCKVEIAVAEEAFVTATSSEILPVREIDGRPFSSPVPGPMTKRLIQAFSRFRQRTLGRTAPAR
jgi:D-alanine transaminase